MTKEATPNSQGIDSIRLIGNYATTLKMVERLGLSVTIPSKNSPVSQTVTNLLKREKYDLKKRYKTKAFSPVVEVVKLTKGKSVSNYMIITRNIPLLFDHAIHHKVKKDNFCLITFTGLHQPNKKIESEATKIMKHFLKRKTFKRHSVDIAIDYQSKKPISKEGLESFKKLLEPYSKHGVTMPSNVATTYYINKVEHLTISNIKNYDKYLKAVSQKENISKSFKDWKRLEFTLTFNVTSNDNRGFMDYLKDSSFTDVLYTLDEVAKQAKIKSYSHCFLEYQISSFLDNRFMNNKKSKKQFNSMESLEHYKQSDFRRYTIQI
jgi:hypothetical protein